MNNKDNMSTNKQKFRFTTQEIAVLGVLMGLGLALSQISIPIGLTNRLSIGFIVTAMFGILYGPIVGGLAAAGVDLLSSFIFGVPGGFFIGFTFTAFMNGVIYGLFLHRKQISWIHVLGAVLMQTLLSNLLLNTLWVNLLYQTPIVVLLASRVPQNLIMAPIRFIVLYVMTQNSQVKKIIDRYAVGRK